MNSPDRNSKPANNRTVLVLDGDVLVRMPVVQFLRDCGYRVVEAASTDEAMAIFQKDRHAQANPDSCQHFENHPAPTN